MNIDWVAGLIDGEGSFWVRQPNKSSSFACGMTLQLRADDREVLEEIRTFTGVGTIEDHNPPSARNRGVAPSVKWVVRRKADVQALARLLDGRMHSKKKRDFELWAEAVDIHARSRYGDGMSERVLDIKRRMEEGRKYVSADECDVC